MADLLKQTRDSGPKRILTPGPVPERIVYGAGSPNSIVFADDSTVTSTCIGCSDRPCYRYSETELSISPLEGFPVDKVEQVCPTDVISPNGPEGLPIIRSDGCIMCGICAARCPVGAIFIDPKKGAVVRTEINKRFVEMRRAKEGEEPRTRLAFATVEREGTMIQETDSLVDMISLRSERVLAGNIRYPTILGRNLLRTVGANAASRRVGVASMRMDVLQKTADGFPGVFEVEFGDEAVLDAPRDILDDVAVMVVRHAWTRGDFQTAIITDALPNRRSEYWRIIADIRNVTGVKILTISVLSLMLAVWRHQKFTRNNFDQFYADEQTRSYLQDIIEKALGFVPRLSSGANRWVNWIK